MKRMLGISIHALRKESDLDIRLNVGQLHISIHALRKESDGSAHVSIFPQIFQSTLSVRRVTGRVHHHERQCHFNPRSP